MSSEKRQSSRVVAVAGAGAIGLSAFFARGLARMGTLLDDVVRLGSRPAISTADDFASASRFAGGTVDDFASSSRFGISPNAGTSLIDDAGNTVANLDDVFAPEAFADEMILASGRRSVSSMARGNRIRVSNRTRISNGVKSIENSSKRFRGGLDRSMDAHDMFELLTDGNEIPFHSPIDQQLDSGVFTERLDRQASSWSPVYQGRQVSICFPEEQLKSIKQFQEDSFLRIDEDNGRVIVELTQEQFLSWISGDLDQNAIRLLILNRVETELNSGKGNSRP
tara:strand:+ start:105387 stop:106229 length:843 start_codon:yes stop_codon:yes gene_type:complete